MEGRKVINIANDFSKFPGGRRKADGPYSGEEFRDTLLIPALKDYDYVEVQLDGVVGYPASFLEEAFGGAVTVLGNSIQKKLSFKVSDDPYVVAEINTYMQRATQKQ